MAAGPAGIYLPIMPQERQNIHILSTLMERIQKAMRRIFPRFAKEKMLRDTLRACQLMGINIQPLAPEIEEQNNPLLNPAQLLEKEVPKFIRIKNVLNDLVILQIQIFSVPLEDNDFLDQETLIDLDQRILEIERRAEALDSI